MDKAAVVQLLQATQISDTQKVEAATNELKTNYHSTPAGFLLLIEIALTHEDEVIRKSAAVQSRSLVARHWDSVDDAQKAAVRSHLLNRFLKETKKSNLALGSRVVAAIASADLEENQGQDLLQAILALNHNSDVRSREFGSMIVFELFDNNPHHFSDDLPDIFRLLNRNLVDPESKEVRLNAARTIWSVLMLVDVDEEASVQSAQNLIPPVVNLLKEAVVAEDDEAYEKLFEVLTLFLSYDSVFMAPHFLELLHFMVGMATNRDLPDDVRSQAIDFVGQCVRFRRMKLQAVKDMGTFLVSNTLKIVTELEPTDDDDDDDDTPARAATTLIDNLSSSLPPRQVIVPLLDEFVKYSDSPDPAYRRAGILAIGFAAEGAPDFLATQLDSLLLPKVLALLQDGDDSVRNAALAGLTYLADHLSEPLAKHHESLVSALLQNIEAATQAPSAKRNVSIIRTACAALDRISESIDTKIMQHYGPKLLATMGELLSHDNYEVKGAAAGAIGAIAESLGKDFQPYFEKVITALAPFVRINGSTDALSLRGSAGHTMGRIAVAVGPETFQSYVNYVMDASQESMKLEGFRLKETTFVLWSQLSKVYQADFRQFLPGVFEALFASLEQTEKNYDDYLDILDDEGCADKSTIKAGDMDVGTKALIADIGLDSDGEDFDDDDYSPVTDVALEKEVAIEAVADLLAFSCDSAGLKEYVEQALKRLEPLTKHSYGGVRKTAIAAFWRVYARVWHIWEEETGTKWQPGLLSNPKPASFLLEVGAMAENVTMRTWIDYPDSAVITEINSSLAATLKACGPAILAVKDSMLDNVIKNVEAIITRSHACQQDMGDDEDAQEVEEGSSELDWLVIDTALDIIISLAAALGRDFLGKFQDTLQQPILKFASSTVESERATAVGVIAEIIKGSGNAVTPLTQQLQALLKRRMSDPDMLTKSNAVYAMGQLIMHSDDTNATISMFQDLWDHLEPLLGSERLHLRDNTCGCLARMMLRHPDVEFVGQVLPKVVERLPLSKDYEENEPVYQCVFKLYEQGNSTVQQLTIPLLAVFEAVLSPPADQLEDSTRTIVQQTVQMLYQAHPAAFQNHPNLPSLAAIA